MLEILLGRNADENFLGVVIKQASHVGKLFGRGVGEAKAAFDSVQANLHRGLVRIPRQVALDKPRHVRLDSPKLALDAGEPCVMIRELALDLLEVLKDQFVRHVLGHGAPRIPGHHRGFRAACKVLAPSAQLAGLLAGSLLLPALLASCLATLPSPSLAQTAQGGTLGIDCDKPRYDANGKLILDFTDGARQAICEAYRTTALTYADNVIETANRLRFAIQTLPPPVWDDLVDHLRTDDDVADWTFTDTAAMGRLETLSTTAPQTQSRDGQTTSSAAHGVATHWQGGILARSGIGADWHTEIQARACGFDADDNPVQGAIVLVWLNPGVVRDSWTPRMVQRTALAWHERQSDRSAAINRVPHVLTAANRITDARGRTSQVTGDPAIWTCLDTVPVGALVEVVRLRQARRDGERALRCEDPDEIGRRRFVWHRTNGVYTVPPFAVLDDGGEHPDRGEPLLGQRPDLPLVTEEPDPTNAARQPGEFLRLGTTCRPPRTIDATTSDPCPAEINGTPVTGAVVRNFRFREFQNDPAEPFRIDWLPVMRDPLDPANAFGVAVPQGVQHPIWHEEVLFCEPDAVPPSEAPVIGTPEDWAVADCAATWPGRFEEGERRGYRQVIDYPDGWAVDDTEIRHIEDDCFNPVAASGQETRDGPECPAGHVGEITEGRDLSWWNLDYATHSAGSSSRRAADRTITDGQGNTIGTLRADQQCKGQSCTRRQGPSRTSLHGIANRAIGWASGVYDGGGGGPDWWDVVTLVTDWRVVSNTCQEPSDDDDDDGGNTNIRQDRDSEPSRGHPGAPDAGANDGHGFGGGNRFH